MPVLTFKTKDKEIVEDALALARKICMPKGSMLHRKMNVLLLRF